MTWPVCIDDVDRAAGENVRMVGSIHPLEPGNRVVCSVVKGQVNRQEADGIVVTLRGEVVPVILQTSCVIALSTHTK